MMLKLEYRFPRLQWHRLKWHPAYSDSFDMSQLAFLIYEKWFGYSDTFLEKHFSLVPKVSL